MSHTNGSVFTPLNKGEIVLFPLFDGAIALTVHTKLYASRSEILSTACEIHYYGLLRTQGLESMSSSHNNECSHHHNKPSMNMTGEELIPDQQWTLILNRHFNSTCKSVRYFITWSIQPMHLLSSLPAPDCVGIYQTQPQDWLDYLSR